MADLYSSFISNLPRRFILSFGLLKCCRELLIQISSSDSRRHPFIRGGFHFSTSGLRRFFVCNNFLYFIFPLLKSRFFGSSDSKKVIFKGVFNQKKEKFLREAVSIRDERFQISKATQKRNLEGSSEERRGFRTRRDIQKS